jgi:hypothetical protein
MHLKPKGLHLRLKNLYSKDQRAKAYSRKKVITPISPEAEILTASVSHGHTSNVNTRQADSQSPADPRHVVTHPNKRAHFATGSAARIDSQIKLVHLSSGLDGKNRRLKQRLAFLAHVLFWAAAYYVLFL